MPLATRSTKTTVARVTAASTKAAADHITAASTKAAAGHVTLVSTKAAAIYVAEASTSAACSDAQTAMLHEQSSRKRRSWSLTETNTITTYFRMWIDEGRLPGKKDILKFLLQNPGISEPEDWIIVRSKVMNIGAAFKKRRQSFFDDMAE